MNKWRFKGNGFTADVGLDNADMETFKKDIMSSLARELCQNSVDAKNKDVKGPVRLEIKKFDVSRTDIPWIEELSKQIDACVDTWKNNAKESKALAVMQEKINESTISCLRISDFNTTGLYGLDEEGTPWHYLIHGSGISDKGGSSGGSKGIGKFATFVASSFNTVFYSTNTIKGEKGYQGISKLCSAKMPGTTEKTQGIGYYGSSEKNEPINGEFKLDKSFTRGHTEYGTDIYIIGFKNIKGWENDIVCKVLDSFMSAIVYGTLEVKIEDTLINAETLNDVVNSDQITKNEKSIRSQYLLLTDKEHRYEDTIDMGEYGQVKLYMVEYAKENEKLATNDCVMIRYPYMKIKNTSKLTTLPCSAMCIIGDNDLNRILRDVENPQHTDWEFKRIEDDSTQKEIRQIYKDLIENIRSTITAHLVTNENTETDIEGAGDFIPEIERNNESNKGKSSKQKIYEIPKTQKNKPKNLEYNINATINDDNGNGLAPDIGYSCEDNQDTTIVSPSGKNNGAYGNVHTGDIESSGLLNDAGNIILRKAELRGMKYRFYCLNKKARKYGITFVSDFTEEDASLELYALDESGTKEKVKIINCLINGIKATVINNDCVKLKIKHGERIRIEMITDQEEMFSGEVKVYAYR